MADTASITSKERKGWPGRIDEDGQDHRGGGVSRRVPHPLYKRIINKRKKFYAHDEEGEAKPGDVVRIIESPSAEPLKRWTLGEMIRKAVQVGVEPSALDLVPGAGPARANRRRRKRRK